MNPLAAANPLAKLVEFEEPDRVSLPLKQVADRYSREEATRTSKIGTRSPTDKRTKKRKNPKRAPREVSRESRRPPRGSTPPTLHRRRSRSPRRTSKHNSSRHTPRRRKRTSRSVSSSIAASSAETDSLPGSRLKLSRTDRSDVSKLNDDLLEAIRPRPEISGFTAAQAKESAATLYRFGRNTLDAANHPKALTDRTS